MNQANTICLMSVVVFIGYITWIGFVCADPVVLGGWVIVIVMMGLALTAYMLGRGWVLGED